MFPENHVLLMIAAGCVDSLAPPRCLNASYYKQILLHPPLQVSQPAPVTATLPYHHQLLWNALIIGCNQPKGKDGGGADKWSSTLIYLLEAAADHIVFTCANTSTLFVFKVVWCDSTRKTPINTPWNTQHTTIYHKQYHHLWGNAHQQLHP